jgi:outer membrane biosynthesis protein TonB
VAVCIFWAGSAASLVLEGNTVATAVLPFPVNSYAQTLPQVAGGDASGSLIAAQEPVTNPALAATAPEPVVVAPQPAPAPVPVVVTPEPVIIVPAPVPTPDPTPVTTPAPVPTTVAPPPAPVPIPTTIAPPPPPAPSPASLTIPSKTNGLLTTHMTLAAYSNCKTCH